MAEPRCRRRTAFAAGDDEGRTVDEDDAAISIHIKSQWRCRESNPGPSAALQGFYGRIPE
jgi:hypothetical protein